jgi:hypothetical protein
MKNRLDLFNSYFNPERFEVNKILESSNVIESERVVDTVIDLSELINTPTVSLEEDRILSTPDYKLTREELVIKANLMFQ